ncbi:hypothetical protein [Streptomyces virginiae]
MQLSSQSADLHSRRAQGQDLADARDRHGFALLCAPSVPGAPNSRW